MNNTIATTLTVAALALTACAPVLDPVSDQNYGGKVDASHTTSGAAVTRFRGCPEWAPKIYRGDMYCLDNYSY